MNEFIVILFLAASQIGSVANDGTPFGSLEMPTMTTISPNAIHQVTPAFTIANYFSDENLVRPIELGNYYINHGFDSSNRYWISQSCGEQYPHNHYKDRVFGFTSTYLSLLDTRL